MSQDNSDGDQVDVNSISDYVALAAKSVLGPIPFAGSLLSEIAGQIIPNQRIDRIAAFARALEESLAKLESIFVRSQLANENFTDLMEEAIRQAARSTTDDRRKHIANLIANSLESQSISFIDSKHLLKLLGEINDIEVIRLASHRYPTQASGLDVYWEKHSEVLTPISASYGDSQEIHDKAALQEGYDEHLTALGLLEVHYSTDHRTGAPEFDHYGRQRIHYRDLSRMGDLLLRYVGIPEASDTA